MPRAALRIFVDFLNYGRPAQISLSPHSAASFQIPAPVMATLPSKVCNSILLVKTAHRTLVNSHAKPWLNSSTPLLANLTTLQICTICNGATREVCPSPPHDIHI